MEEAQFKRILTSFADTPTHIDLTKGQLLAQLRDEVVTATISRSGGELVVTENGETLAASKWLINRVARLPLLADRILTLLPEVPHFVNPGGQLLDFLDNSPDEKPFPLTEVTSKAAEVLSRRLAGTTSILYLTSDAGEGKTSVINQLAREQATRYKNKESDWLLLPVSLGGRPFLRLDDIIIGSLVNKYRFQLLYYEAFLELVRLGVIVPALDGFEEMFVEDASGDGVSALGNFVQALKSSGSLLVAARKAYFEYKSFQTQSRLFDGLQDCAVTFARLAINRWDRTHFLDYAEKRQIPDGGAVYDDVSTRMGNPKHPLLTRAVLVKRLLDVASKLEDRRALLDALGKLPEDFFAQFVTTILDREANEKWVNRAGEPVHPLLSVEEHCELLTMIAKEMWTTRSAVTRVDSLQAIAELFCDNLKKEPTVTRQVIGHITHHALLLQCDSSGRMFSFDHEEFYHYFLGRALGEVLAARQNVDLRETLRAATLPASSMDVAVRYALQNKANARELVSELISASHSEGVTSFIRENSGGLIVRILHGAQLTDITVSEVSFPLDFLIGKTLVRVKFSNCYFQPTALEGTTLNSCSFENCEFERLELARSEKLDDVWCRECQCHAVVPIDSEATCFDPALIDGLMRQAGFSVSRTAEIFPTANQPVIQPEQRLVLIERAFRAFLRSNEVNESTMRLKLGDRGADFVENVIPILLKAEVLSPVTYHGHGKNRRFRLNVRMEVISNALAACQGRLDSFVDLVRVGR